MSETGTAPPLPEAVQWRAEQVPGVTLGETWVPWLVIEELKDRPDVPGTIPLHMPAVVRDALARSGLGALTRSGGLTAGPALAPWLRSVRQTAEPDEDGLPSSPGLNGRLLRDIAVLREASPALMRAFRPSRSGGPPPAAVMESLEAATAVLALAAHRLHREAMGGPAVPDPVPDELAARRRKEDGK